MATRATAVARADSVTRLLFSPEIVAAFMASTVPAARPPFTATTTCSWPDWVAGRLPRDHCTLSPDRTPPPEAETKVVPAGTRKFSVVPVMLLVVARLP